MNDNDVIRIIIALLDAGYTALGLGDVLVKQAYQPTLQGTPSTRAVFLRKVMAPRYGHPGKSDVYNAGDEDFDTTESIWRTPTFQLSGLAVQDPSDTASLTASDITEKAADILQTRATRQTLLASGIGIERIKDIRLLYFRDDREQNEQVSLFDFIVSYRVDAQSKTPVVEAYEADIYRV